MDSPFRGALYSLVTTQITDYLLMAVVLLSCVEVRGRRRLPGLGWWRLRHRQRGGGVKLLQAAVQAASGCAGSAGCAGGLLTGVPSRPRARPPVCLPVPSRPPQMAMETAHDDPASSRARALHWIDVATTAVFGLEAAAKVLAFGFRPYIAFNTNKVPPVGGCGMGGEGRGVPGWLLRLCGRRLAGGQQPASSWEAAGGRRPPACEALPQGGSLPPLPPALCSSPQLDLAVVVVSVVVLVAEAAHARALRVLKVLRAVRPLRMLTRSQSMLMVAHTLLRSLAAMGNVTGMRGGCVEWAWERADGAPERRRGTCTCLHRPYPCPSPRSARCAGVPHLQHPRHPALCWSAVELQRRQRGRQGERGAGGALTGMSCDAPGLRSGWTQRDAWQHSSRLPACSPPPGRRPSAWAPLPTPALGRWWRASGAMCVGEGGVHRVGGNARAPVQRAPACRTACISPTSVPLPSTCARADVAEL